MYLSVSDCILTRSRKDLQLAYLLTNLTNLLTYLLIYLLAYMHTSMHAYIITQFLNY